MSDISYCKICSRGLDSEFEPEDYLDWLSVGGWMYCPRHKEKGKEDWFNKIFDQVEKEHQKRKGK